MKTLYLVACCAKKKEGCHRAEDLYISPLFRKSRAWVLSQMQPGDQWGVLSAWFGWLSPTMSVYSYNYSLSSLSPLARLEWGISVWFDIESFFCRLKFTRICFLAGELYVAPVRAAILASFRGSITINEPLQGLGIGKRLAWFNDHEKARGL